MCVRTCRASEIADQRGIAIAFRASAALEASTPVPDQTTAVCGPAAPSPRLLETADDYGGVVVSLNPDWRVIECRDRVQWVLQHRGSPKGHVKTIGVAGATAEPPRF